MATAVKTRIPELVEKHESEILEQWMKEQTKSQSKMIKEAELKEQSVKLLKLLREGLQAGSIDDVSSPAWDDMKTFISSISSSRAVQGFSPSDTATFIFSIKNPLFTILVKTYSNDTETLAAEVLTADRLLDKLGLFSTETFMRTREKIISRQQEEMLELSTPVVKLWDGILALPMIGTLDSSRTQVVMESLLQKIVETGSEIAIVDITGVPTVDTLVAQYLLKTVAAARLMGADCIISGIRPQIAQTMVHLGVDLSQVVTKASLADAFIVALARTGRKVAAGAQPTPQKTPGQIQATGSAASTSQINQWN